MPEGSEEGSEEGTGVPEVTAWVQIVTVITRGGETRLHLAYYSPWATYIYVVDLVNTAVIPVQGPAGGQRNSSRVARSGRRTTEG